MKYLLIKTAQIITEGKLEGVPKAEITSDGLNSFLQWLFGVFAVVAVLIIGIAAFRIVISRGNSQDVGRSRDAIIYASIGLIISLAAFIIVTFVVERI